MACTGARDISFKLLVPENEDLFVELERTDADDYRIDVRSLYYFSDLLLENETVDIGFEALVIVEEILDQILVVYDGAAYGLVTHISDSFYRVCPFGQQLMHSFHEVFKFCVLLVLMVYHRLIGIYGLEDTLKFQFKVNLLPLIRRLK